MTRVLAALLVCLSGCIYKPAKLQEYGDDRGGDESGAGGDMDLSFLVVEPVYPAHSSWNAYIAFNSILDPFGQAGTPCTGDELHNSACLHSGEMRRVPIRGYTSCEGLSLDDARGAFRWE
ncbi:MAG: hypothetical protein JRI68_29835, partial [Deltaproteobacteria bacterium]|nr:hypothetical protein [Deltaproteobacteria bacterium]